MGIAVGQHDFQGEFWNTDVNASGITRLQFLHGTHVSAWGACFPEDCPWGETEFHLLNEMSNTSGVQYAFATWGSDSELTHCLLTLVDDELTVVQIAIRSEYPSYKMTETFRKDAERSAEVKNADPLRKFKYMWDGSQSGWKLIQYTHQVFFAELNFDESGPTRSEFPAVFKLVGPFPDETYDQMWERLRGCTGIGLPSPIGPLGMGRLRAFQLENNLNLTVCTIDPDDYLVLAPSGHHFGWMALQNYRKSVIERMLDAGVPVVSGRLE